MKTFFSLISDIKQLKIQGAQNVAFAGIKALKLSLNDKKIKNYNYFKLNDYVKKTILKISLTRSTEPMMRNILHFYYLNLDYSSIINLKKSFIKLEKKTNKIIIDGEKKIIKYGFNKIQNNNIIYTHCHSSTVTKIIIKSKNKKIKVHNTETRPLFQGRITSKEIAKKNIPVEHYVDSSVRLALKNANIILLGADAITVDGVYNKIGSEMIAIIANYYKIPLYICSHSWKYDFLTEFGFEEKIEKRHSKEVWLNPPKGVKINNFAFEKIDFNLINGIISEFGVLLPSLFINEVKKNKLIKY